MEKDKRNFNWDGKSRVVSNIYRENFDELLSYLLMIVRLGLKINMVRSMKLKYLV